MSRSGYVDDFDPWAMIRWRGAVSAAIRGRRGQALLRGLADAMDAMPEKRLIADELESQGEHCALGVVGKNRGVDMADIEPDNEHQVSSAFNIAKALAQEIVFINDEACVFDETPEQRWVRVRRWVEDNLIEVGHE